MVIGRGERQDYLKRSEGAGFSRNNELLSVEYLCELMKGWREFYNTGESMGWTRHEIICHVPLYCTTIRISSCSTFLRNTHNLSIMFDRNKIDSYFLGGETLSQM